MTLLQDKISGLYNGRVLGELKRLNIRCSMYKNVLPFQVGFSIHGNFI